MTFSSWSKFLWCIHPIYKRMYKIHLWTRGFGPHRCTLGFFVFVSFSSKGLRRLDTGCLKNAWGSEILRVQADLTARIPRFCWWNAMTFLQMPTKGDIHYIWLERGWLDFSMWNMVYVQWYSGWCSTPTLLLTKAHHLVGKMMEHGHPLLICSSLTTTQYSLNLNLVRWSFCPSARWT